LNKLNRIKKVFLFELKDKFRTTSLLQLKKLFKTIKIREKWQTLKESTQTVEEWFQLIIMACIGVVLIWKFIMGNPSNFEGGNNEGTLNTLGQVYHGGAVCRYY
jgi:biopolymer transport protein ExbB